MRKALIGLSALLLVISGASAADTVTVQSKIWDTLDQDKYLSTGGDITGDWDISGAESGSGSFSIDFSDSEKGIQKVELNSKYGFDYVTWYLYIDGEKVDQVSNNGKKTLTLEAQNTNADTLKINTSSGGTGSTDITGVQVFSQAGLEKNKFASAVSFAGEYFEKPESISCALTYAPIFGDCWVDLGLFTFGDDSKNIFLTDLETNAATIEEDRKATLSSLDLLNNQSYGIAQAGGKFEAIRQLNNGTVETTAKQEVRDEVKDFWAERQKNLVVQHQLEVLEFNSTMTTADAVGASPGEMFQSNYNGFTVNKKSFTLVNGTDVPVYDLRSNSGDLIQSFTDTGGSGLTTSDGYLYLAGSQYAEKNQNLVDLQVSAYQAANELTGEIYANYSEGDLSVDDAAGPLEETRLLSTNLADSGASSYLAGTYRQMGLASEFNASFEVNYTNQGMNTSETLTGNLFVEKEGFSNFSVGETYSAEKKTAYMIHQGSDGEARSTSLDGNFTVQAIYNTATGGEIDSTTVQQSDFYSPDIQNLSAQLTEYQERIEELESSGVGGTGGGSWSPFQIGLGASLFVILALLLVIGGATLA
jgi:hypothetical protein